ncbi:hypothetical protein L7F22_027692 [Adiantum nelumboides]|nr:hypothetical protein [Adiantum nelumboides]
MPSRVLGYLRDIARWLVTRFVNVWKLGMQNAAMEMDPPVVEERLQPAMPESYPLKTLDELEDFSYLDSFHFPFNKSSVPLKCIPTRTPERPRLLVCHDMKGGYQDDRWVQGSPNSDAYSIWHWHLIDIFIYFSHSLVTLPPPCWVNAAHRHGVQVSSSFFTFLACILFCNIVFKAAYLWIQKVKLLVFVLIWKVPRT